ncbi:MAG: alpha/beta hydrolase [Pseudomonadota bacterium]
MSDAPAAPPSFLETPDGRRIAYRKLDAKTQQADAPGVVFLSGYRSDMTGTKATFLEDWARARGRAFLRFDYTGHGASSGDFETLAIGDWAQDAEDALLALTAGPQILVGSSMGGWIALILAKRRPERLAGLVGVAAAPDFTEDLMWGRFSADERNRLEREGRLEQPNDYDEEPYVITRRLIEDGRAHLVLLDPLRIDRPVRLLQGSADRDVPQTVALRLLAHLEGPDVRLTIVKDADHRMSEPAELELLAHTLDALPAD